MRVEAELLDHPKFMRLKSLLGPSALEVLLRIWGHCQSCHRGGHWGQVDAWYVEAVARWSGDVGKCMDALKTCRFIDVGQDGSVSIHDWDLMNSHMVKAWSNGKKGGRKPQQPIQQRHTSEPSTDPLAEVLTNHKTEPQTDRLTETEPKPNRSQNLQEGRKDIQEIQECREGGSVEQHTQASNPAESDHPQPSFAEVPSLQEVLEAASSLQEGVGDLIGCPPIRPGWAQNWWEWRSNSATLGFQTLRSWRTQLARDWRRQWRTWEAREKSAEKSGEGKPRGPETAWMLKQRIEALEAQIRDHPGNPGNTAGSLERKKREKPAWENLRRELRALQQQLGGAK